MIRRTSLAILVLIVSGLGVVSTLPTVHACGIAPLAAEDRLPTFVSQATAVVVGEVVSRRPGEFGYEDVEFAPISVLAGEVPDRLRLQRIGELEADCGGGPPLPDGDRFLLFLTDTNVFGQVGRTNPGQLRIVYLGLGVYRLDGGNAFHYSGYYSPPAEDPAGSADAVLSRVGSMLDSDPAEIDRAIAYANGERALSSGPNRVAVWGSVGVALIAVGVLAGWYMRSRRRR